VRPSVQRTRRSAPAAVEHYATSGGGRRVHPRSGRPAAESPGGPRSGRASATADPVIPPGLPAAPERPRPGHGRTQLPASLPRRRVEHALPDAQCTCHACGARLVKIGEETLVRDLLKTGLLYGSRLWIEAQHPGSAAGRARSARAVRWNPLLGSLTEMQKC
jgi:hypothetical protein